MKKILLFACGLFLFGMASNAQSTDTASHGNRPRMERRGPGGRGPMMMGPNKELAKKLNLTDDQQTKLKAINEDFRKQADGIKGNTSLTDDQKKEAFRDLFKKNREAQNAVYTDEQKEIIKKDMQERRAHRGDRKGGRPGGDNQQTESQS
ncbi:protein refolding chaperone Spy/CpxP family [Arachidicoccus rhizosphaerae]|uniref:Protein refolding chaperone Spy/CpxP family n=1 Tax=Arachidicoccus rhizosphaerae TaxID=551991 RepID=A0A1H3VLZ6_9BACT|nr:Spy/CpxP family protein refolding chaperone [Arachidicoccus rhizosphaerae]SDZ75274.1 protein refolding chaperone Spy/CpxP family [Arachidicoccus rhizosphaerae]